MGAGQCSADVEHRDLLLEDTRLPDAERADLMLAAALLCYESGAFKPAETLIAEIVKIDPAAGKQ